MLMFRAIVGRLVQYLLGSSSLLRWSVWALGSGHTVGIAEGFSSLRIAFRGSFDPNAIGLDMPSRLVSLSSASRRIV